MQEGSIVVMNKPMEEALWEALSKLLIKPPPRPSSTEFIVTALASEKECEEMEYKQGGIYIDEYPEYFEKGIPFDITLFSELLPPDLNVQEMVEKKPEVKKQQLEFA